MKTDSIESQQAWFDYMMSKRINHADFMVFLTIGLIVSVVIFYFIDKQTQFFKDKRTSINQTQFEAILHGEQRRAERFYDDHAHYIARHISQLPELASQQQDDLRNQLLNRYQTYFDNAKNQGLGVLHIFDRDGNSFLRFHRPERFGDNLLDTRYSLRQITEEQRYSTGFEAGRAREAYRFVFPLFYNGDYIGGMEYSIDFSTIGQQLNTLFGGAHQQLLLTKAIEESLWSGELSRIYSPSQLHKDYVINKQHQVFEAGYQNWLPLIKTHPDFTEQFAQQNAFTLFLKHPSGDIATSFLPLLDTQKQFLGYLLSTNVLPGKPITRLNFLLWGSLLLFWALWSLLYFFWSRARQSQRFAQDLLDAQSSMLVLSQNNRLQYANKTLLKHLGFNNFADMRSRYDCICDLFIEEEGYLSKTINGQRWIDYILSTPNQEHKAKVLFQHDLSPHVLEISVTPFSEGLNNAHLVTLHDITESEQRHQKLYHESEHDPLTSAYNRRGADTLFASLKHEKRTYSMVMFDIDHFKNINDQYGHDAGDEALQILAKLIHSHLRHNDALIRWGGEEFIILLKATKQEEACAIANKLRLLIAEQRFSLIPAMTCSFGVTQAQQNEAIESIIKRCDQHLYLAKTSGRNRCVSDQDLSNDTKAL